MRDRPTENMRRQLDWERREQHHIGLKILLILVPAGLAFPLLGVVRSFGMNQVMATLPQLYDILALVGVIGLMGYGVVLCFRIVGNLRRRLEND